MKKIIGIVLIIALTLSFCACRLEGGGEPSAHESLAEESGKTSEPSGEKLTTEKISLTDNITAATVSGKEADKRFISAMASFAIELFQKNASGENALIAPLSVMLALSMTANGANGETLTAMQEALGGDISLSELNEYLYAYAKKAKTDENVKFRLANSVWFRDNEDAIKVEQEFLQKNADYYGAYAYKAPFDAQTLKDINDWIDRNTDGMIKEMLSEISNDAVMYLINALVFEAEWLIPYYENQIRDDTFKNYDGKEQTVKMMSASENKYISDGSAVGFIKDYKGGEYSFAALLPNEGTDIYEYIASLSGERFIDTINGAKAASVSVSLPKFSYEFSVNMNDSLKNMGMNIAFDSSKADFTKIDSSHGRGLYIGNVLHKTFISVSEKGTKAGAATVVEMNKGALDMPAYEVRLERPFVYAIIDNSTGLPIFIGALTEIDG